MNSIQLKGLQARLFDNSPVSGYAEVPGFPVPQAIIAYLKAISEGDTDPAATSHTALATTRSHETTFTVGSEFALNSSFEHGLRPTHSINTAFRNVSQGVDSVRWQAAIQWRCYTVTLPAPG